MKVVIITCDANLVSSFEKASKRSNLFKKEPLDIVQVNVKDKENLYHCENDAVVVVIDNECQFSQSSLDEIKDQLKLVPIAIVGQIDKINNVNGMDIYVSTDGPDLSKIFHPLFSMLLSYSKNFEALKKSMRPPGIIKFDEYEYDPLTRILRDKDKQIARFTKKGGGIFEELFSNFGKMVHKDVILEKVWKRSDYFTGRSMDVYVTHLRNTLRDNSINIKIKNISGVGLILEKSWENT